MLITIETNGFVHLLLLTLVDDEMIRFTHFVSMFQEQCNSLFFMHNEIVLIFKVNERWLLVLTGMNLKPKTEMMAAMAPMVMAPHGWTIMSADVPTATPPARVAF